MIKLYRLDKEKQLMQSSCQTRLCQPHGQTLKKFQLSDDYAVPPQLNIIDL